MKEEVGIEEEKLQPKPMRKERGRSFNTTSRTFKQGVKDQGAEAETSELEDLVKDAIFELAEMKLQPCKNLRLAIHVGSLLVHLICDSELEGSL